jgi:hypothetical protein
MVKKKVTLFGTTHCDVTNAPEGLQDAYVFILNEIEPQVVLEEWSTVQKHRSAAAAAADNKNVPWESIGTPAEDRFWTFGPSDALGFPSASGLLQYGPIANQESREVAMCENIQRAMETRETALLVIGLAHLHSMFVKLSPEFDVKGYALFHE